MPATVKLDLREFEIRLKVLKNPQAPLVRALNRSIASGKTLAARVIAQDMGLKVADVRERYLEVREATSSKLEATISASARRVPLIFFGASGPEPSRGRPPGVRAKLKGGAGLYPHAFIATVGTGRHRGVFRRRTKARFPIDQLHGPSVWQSFQKHEAAIHARAEEQLGKNVAHEIAYAMSK